MLSPHNLISLEQFLIKFCSYGRCLSALPVVKFSMEEHQSLKFKSIKCVCFKYLRKFVLVPEHLLYNHKKM